MTNQDKLSDDTVPTKCIDVHYSQDEDEVAGIPKFQEAGGFCDVSLRQKFKVRASISVLFAIN